MAKALLIAEKPSLMREIKSVYTKNRGRFKDQIDFMAQAGHILGLKSPKEVDPAKYGKPWREQNIPEIYPYEYKVSPDKTKMLKEIREAVKKGGYDYIIHAGDPDQEGELLVKETLVYIGNKLPVKRFWTNDLTEGAILNALSNLKDDEAYNSLYDAALVRQHADYQFGMNCTMAASVKTGDLCKIGRVKGPIISILAKRELEIQNYVEKKTYRPAFKYKGCEFVKDELFDNPEAALSKVPKTQYADISEAKYDKKYHKAPKLFKLSTLQTEAHSRLGWSGQKTLDVLQSLYEAKAVSYPRTACEYISSQVDIGFIAKRVLGEVSVDRKMLQRDPSEVLKDTTYANDDAIQSEGHTAVIPTGVGLPSRANSDEAALYEIIVRRFLAIFGAQKETMSVKVTGVPSGTKDPYVFTESYDLSPGYELVLNPGYKLRESSGVKFEKGQNIHPIEFFAKEFVSQKPPRYNDGTLIKAMETPEKYEGEEGNIKYSIGTPATRAGIIEECQKNGYFSKVKGSFVASDKAIKLYQAFGETVPMFRPVESGKWEELLDKVRKGQTSAQDAEEQLIRGMESSCKTIEEGKVESFASVSLKGKGNGNAGSASSPSVADCPNCGSQVKSGQYGLYCANKCGIVFGKVFGKQLTDAQWKKAIKGERFVLKNLKSKAGKVYSAYVKAEGVEDYSFKKEDGNEFHGKRLKFSLDGYYNEDKEK